jgi:hypothetical protein
VRFNASTVLMSGFGAPARIASATGVPATFVMLPDANFCCLSLVHNWPRQNNHVGSFAVQDALSDVGYKAIADVKFVSGCLLEIRSNLVQCRRQCD